jgi:hypothetical protein
MFTSVLSHVEEDTCHMRRRTHVIRLSGLKYVHLCIKPVYVGDMYPPPHVGHSLTKVCSPLYQATI